MGDPLSDPRAQMLLSASPGEASSLAASFRSVGTQAQVVAAGLRGAQNDATWTGSAAGAFRAQVGKLPGQLDQVQHAYNEVGTALYQYEGQLSPIQSQFRSLADQLTSARQALASAQSSLATAKTNLNTVTSGPNVKPNSPAVTQAGNAVSSATSSANTAQDEVSRLEAQGYRLLDEFDTVRGQARSKVSTAAGIAPQEHHSWLSGALHAIGNALGDAGKFVFNAGKGIVDDIGNLPHAIDEVYHHPGDLSAWGTLVKDVAVTASVVAMVAAPFAAPEIAEADAAVDGAAGAADAAAGGEGAADAAAGASRFGTAMRGVNTWGSRVSTAGGLSDSGFDIAKGDYRGALIDGAFALAPSAGDHLSDALGVGDKAADGAAESYKSLASAQESVSDYQQYRDWGLSSATAKQMAFGEDGVPEGLDGVNLDDPQAVQQSYQHAYHQMVTTANKAMHIGKPVAGTVDQVQDAATDKVKDKIRAHLDPAAAGA